MALTVSIDEVWEGGGKRYTRGTIALNNTTYAAGGLDLPTKQEFGFRRQMDTLVIMGDEDGPTSLRLFTWDKSAHKLQAFVSHDTAGATALPMDEEGADALGNGDLLYVASGW